MSSSAGRKLITAKYLNHPDETERRTHQQQEEAQLSRVCGRLKIVAVSEVIHT